jgi:cyclopropane fatty-acyl-phospholipid synthase-like methyltransferase
VSPDRLDLAARRVDFRNGRRYRARAGFVFDGIDLGGRRVLEVGAGKGAFALWAGLHGASRVLAIEPEADGSEAASFGALAESVELLGLTGTVEARSAFLEDLSPADGPFDVVVLYDVINHLDETATTGLHEGGAAATAFDRILGHLRSLVADGGTVVVADAARNNLWDRLGLRSPLSPAIEWEKHQQPEVWATAFERAGFTRRDIRWSPLYPFGRLSANRLVQYATASHFVLRVTAT